MQYISSRFIDGNRGDLLSRYGILSALEEIGLAGNLTVIAAKEEHVKPLSFKIHNYGLFYNSLPDTKGWNTIAFYTYSS